MTFKKTSKTVLGRIGECRAMEFLNQRGYSIICQNYRFRHLEIDIVAQINNVLVFVEVKARKNNQFGYPESFVSNTKAQNVIAAATNYIEETNWSGNIRFDIIAVTGKDIQHFEDAFY